ncbi:MAG: hypothetical protein COW03_14415 [Cytophagales bacterium CG12_big_fil_rev_8_21_14_0_65_40_12]|nr:MAG: hypothetical protein COW03_14415 [Cytophagales bacterium CG12_big_fil_rev_8_21_14_0_65_40_12]PIW04122.1 MAG: hypothetical protein COW40_11600 [Cytophagales bacterium CG17_big_fil_post_rev_8_21_14_2_50_40_13]
MRNNLFYLLIYLLIFTSCNSNKSNRNQYFETDFLKSLDEQVLRLDSISLSDSDNYFNLFIDTDQIGQNKILASQVPNLSFYLLDSLGNVEMKVAQKGQGPGLLGNVQFANGTLGDSGRIYILTSGNTYQLFVFDALGGFIKSFPLFKFLSDVFFPVTNSSFEVIEKEDDTVLVTFSTGSTLYAHESKEYFENATGVAQFTIDMDSLKVTGYKAKLPLIQLPEIQEALKDEGFYWEDAYPIFDYENGLFYLTYAFSRELFVYDQQFNLIDTIDLKTLKSIPNRNFVQKIGSNDDEFLVRAINTMRRRNENRNIQRISVKGNKVVLQFTEILKEGSYELPSNKNLGVPKKVSDRILNHALFKDLKTNEERFITFPEDHYSVFMTDHQDFLVHVIPREREEVFLLKYRLKK